MAACCGVPRCSCRVIAGPGVTVDGNGSAATPYVISAGSTPTSIQARDTPTVDTTVSGTGVGGDPYIVSADVILDPAPPGGGANLLEAGPDGLYVECADVRTCFTGGDGIVYDPATGEISAQLSTDAGNTVSFGTDGGLFVPPDTPLEVGCGLQGDGSTGAPIEAFPIAGERAWTTDWTCDAANSTLHCDPDSGGLWTPPEHTSAAVTIQQNHPLGTPVIAGPTAFIIIDSTAWAEATYTADSLTACRGLSFSTRFTGHVEASWTANATWDLGYAIQINGGALAVRQTHSKLAAGPAGRERWSFGVSQAVVLPPHTGYAVRVYPAIRVTAGTVTIQQWITDTDMFATTR